MIVKAAVESAQDINDGAARASLMGNIDVVGHLQVRLAAQVGTVSMSIRQLLALKAGEVVAMEELLDEPVTLLLDGKVIARAELLGVGDHFGVRILEVS